MNTITTLRDDVQRANTERLDQTMQNVAHDLEYLSVDGESLKLEDGKSCRVGLELWLKEPRLLEHLGLADYLIHDAREEQRVCLTEKGAQLYTQLKEEGFYQK